MVARKLGQLTFLLFIFIQTGFGQRNSFEISPMIGYVFSYADFEPPSFLYLNHFRGELPLSKGILGESYGISFGYDFMQKNRISLFGRYVTKGQKTSTVFISGGIDKDSLDFRYSSGGVYVQLTQQSTEFGLKYSRLLFEANNFQLYFGGGLSLDVTDKLIIQNFILGGERGFVDWGCCRKKFFVEGPGYFERLGNNFSERNIRLGFSLSFYARFFLSDYLFIFFQPEGQSFTNYIIDKRRSFLDGTIKNVIIQSGVGIKL
jgi:hypothetical protein